jgi:hypothetical protein
MIPTETRNGYDKQEERTDPLIKHLLLDLQRARDLAVPDPPSGEPEPRADEVAADGGEEGGGGVDVDGLDAHYGDGRVDFVCGKVGDAEGQLEGKGGGGGEGEKNRVVRFVLCIGRQGMRML